MADTTGELGWCVLELFGHRRLAGWVTEQQIAGVAMLRVDVPDPAARSWTATQFYSPQAVYAITPTTEEVAVAVASRDQPEPVSRWELPAASTGEPVKDDEPEDAPF